MKKRLLAGIIFISIISNIQAAKIGQVIRKQDNMILIRVVNSVLRKGDVITIQRETTNGLIQIGTARVMRVIRNQVGAKVVTLKPGVSIRPGDVITDDNDATSVTSKSSIDYDMIEMNSALEKLLFVSNPYHDQINATEDEFTALEKMWLNLQAD